MQIEITHARLDEAAEVLCKSPGRNNRAAARTHLIEAIGTVLDDKGRLAHRHFQHAVSALEAKGYRDVDALDAIEMTLVEGVQRADAAEAEQRRRAMQPTPAERAVAEQRIEHMRARLKGRAREIVEERSESVMGEFPLERAYELAEQEIADAVREAMMPRPTSALPKTQDIEGQTADEFGRGPNTVQSQNVTFPIKEDVNCVDLLGGYAFHIEATRECALDVELDGNKTTTIRIPANAPQRLDVGVWKILKTSRVVRGTVVKIWGASSRPMAQVTARLSDRIEEKVSEVEARIEHLLVRNETLETKLALADTKEYVRQARASGLSKSAAIERIRANVDEQIDELVVNSEKLVDQVDAVWGAS